jgi:uncharacterized membrane protein YpjA
MLIVLLVMVLFSFLIGLVAYYVLECVQARSLIPRQRFSLAHLMIAATWIVIVLGIVTYVLRR